MKVKICGTTNLADALVAVDAGADFLGFIFYPPSPRGITPAKAQAITAHLRRSGHCPVLVGVFVNETPERMTHILDECQLDLAQLHGDEPPWLVGDERSPIYGRVFKALRPTSLAEAEADAEWYIPPSPTHPSLLIDTYHPTLRGGTGAPTNWHMSAHLAQKVPGLMLAGGLTPHNVADAVRQVKPYAVDVASGVEQAPGQKEPALVHAFVANARQF